MFIFLHNMQIKEVHAMFYIDFTTPEGKTHRIDVIKIQSHMNVRSAGKYTFTNSIRNTRTGVGNVLSVVRRKKGKSKPNNHIVM